MRILGLAAYYHDSAAALLVDGRLVAAAQEERFTRQKHDPGFPRHAAAYCLAAAGVRLAEVDYVTFYDKPLIKFERLLETYLACAPRGFASFLAAMPVWLQDKLFLKATLKRELAALGGVPVAALPPLLFTEHHQAHAASAFFPSPFAQAAVLCLDGVGEWATTTAWRGRDHRLAPLWQLDFPHSLGLLYSAFTYYTGFRVNSGEYKLMGLAPYGRPTQVQTLYDHLLDLKPDGTFRLNLDYFAFATGLTMTNQRFADLFGLPPRAPEAPLTQAHMDLARSVQVVTEEIVLRLARTLRQETGERQLCLAGGVALNCVANGRLLRERVFDELWIQPAAGDAGGAVGAAYSTWHEYRDQPRTLPAGGGDATSGSYLGPSFTTAEVEAALTALQAPYRRLAESALLAEVARLLDEGQVVGWVQGRMEFGPRALGARSILGDPRHRRMQSTMNLKIKYRESFRPFAPAVLAEAAPQWFALDCPSPYMLLVAEVRPEHRLPLSAAQQQFFGLDLLQVPRSTIPAVTHVDYSARVQTVHAETNPRFHRLLQAFAARTGCPVLINTSFNVRGEPIVCTPEDAYRCFMRTEIDYLVVEDCLLAKADQPPVPKDASWQQEFALD
jgi:carbamoyltransferase